MNKSDYTAGCLETMIYVGSKPAYSYDVAKWEIANISPKDPTKAREEFVMIMNEVLDE